MDLDSRHLTKTMTIAVIDKEAPKPVNLGTKTERLRAWFDSYRMMEPTEGVELRRFPYLRKHLTEEALLDPARKGVTDAAEGVITEVDANTYKIRFLFGSDVLHVDGLQVADEESVKVDLERRSASAEKRITDASAGLPETDFKLHIVTAS
jgi:hypothetical protein